MVDVFSGSFDARGVVVAVHGDQPLRQLPEQLDLVLVLVHLRVERLRKHITRRVSEVGCWFLLEQPCRLYVNYLLIVKHITLSFLVNYNLFLNFKARENSFSTSKLRIRTIIFNNIYLKLKSNNWTGSCNKNHFIPTRTLYSKAHFLLHLRRERENLCIDIFNFAFSNMTIIDNN